MSATTLTKTDDRRIDGLVRHYVESRAKFEALLYQLTGYVTSSDSLSALMHSYKHRTKDPEHLRDKLRRKCETAKKAGDAFEITDKNLFTKINDLAGFRLIHLHTKQIEQINTEFLKILDEQRWIVLEGPVAKTWDDESRQYFTSLGMGIEASATLYTSIHYVVQPNSRSELTCEVQVRTLMEEVWGEVDHRINYPIKSASRPCRDQIKVLARLTSSCSRLVDSIFLANADGIAQRPLIAKRTRPSKAKANAARHGAADGIEPTPKP